VTSNVASDVGRRIALLRQRLGLSQIAFARQAGISRNALLDYERGSRVPKSANLGRIAETAGCSIDWLLNGQGSRADARDDAAFEAAVLALRALWRDRTRRRLAITVLAALARKSDGPA
jgi:transcriptional regulator with XRE-family HTH domain